MTPLFALLLAAAPAPVSPEAIAAAIQCAPRDNYDAVVEALYAKRPPTWLKPVEEKDLPVGMDAFALDRPITVFGQAVSRVYLMSDWIVVAMPTAAGQTVVAGQHLMRVPIKATKQYYRFVDPEAGPMIGAFEPPQALFLRAFGVPADAVPPPTKLYVGCNYTPASEAEFLATARGADAAARDAASDIRAMIEHAPDAMRRQNRRNADASLSR